MSPFDSRVITVEDWAENRRLYRSVKLSQAAMARQLAPSQNTVAKALRSEVPPLYERALVTRWHGSGLAGGAGAACAVSAFRAAYRIDRQRVSSPLRRTATRKTTHHHQPAGLVTIAPTHQHRANKTTTND